MAALAGQLAKVEEDEAAERAAKRAAADKKTQALAAVAKRLHTLRKTKKRSQ